MFSAAEAAFGEDDYGAGAFQAIEDGSDSWGIGFTAIEGEGVHASVEPRDEGVAEDFDAADEIEEAWDVADEEGDVVGAGVVGG